MAKHQLYSEFHETYQANEDMDPSTGCWLLTLSLCCEYSFPWYGFYLIISCLGSGHIEWNIHDACSLTDVKKVILNLSTVYNVVLVSSTQQSDSVMCLCVCIYIFFRYFSTFDCCKIFLYLPMWYRRSLLFIYFTYSIVCMVIPNYSFIPPPLWEPWISFLCLQVYFSFVYWLCWVFVAAHGFLSLGWGGLLSSCGAWASHCGSFALWRMDSTLLRLSGCGVWG